MADNGDTYRKQLEHYNYVENQQERYINLVNYGNESIVQFAQILFSEPLKNLKSKLSPLLLEESMESADIFCMLVELVLRGLNILGNFKIFDLDGTTNELVSILRSYLQSAGFDMVIIEADVEPSEWYCQIVPNGSSEWKVLDYNLILNRTFWCDKSTQLENFQTFFVGNNHKIFVIKFNLHRMPI